MEKNKSKTMTSILRFIFCLVISYLIFNFILLKGYDAIKILACSFIYSVVLYFMWITLKSVITYIYNRSKVIKVKNDEELNYFKELRNNYSTSELYFIYSGIRNFEKSLIVKFYHMEKKEKVLIEDKKLTVMVSDEILNEEDKMMINDFNTMRGSIFKAKYMALVEKKLFDKNILKIHRGFFYDNSHIVKILFIVMVLALLFLNNQITNSCVSEGSLYICDKNTLTFYLFLAIVLLPLSMFIRVIFESFLRKKMKHYSLTDEGKKLRSKLKGLKRYIKKHKLKNDESLADYLFILDIKSKTVNEITKKYSYLFKI